MNHCASLLRAAGAPRPGRGDLRRGGVTTVEISAALARREREALAEAPDEIASALAATREARISWHEIMPSDALRQTSPSKAAARALDARLGDQVCNWRRSQIAVADHDTTAFEIVCLDARLTSAARREGFTVIDL